MIDAESVVIFYFRNKIHFSPMSHFARTSVQFSFGNSSNVEVVNRLIPQTSDARNVESRFGDFTYWSTLEFGAQSFIRIRSIGKELCLKKGCRNC